jgi:hypothetical protein
MCRTHYLMIKLTLQLLFDYHSLNLVKFELVVTLGHHRTITLLRTVTMLIRGFLQITLRRKVSVLDRPRTFVLPQPLPREQGVSL